MRLRYEKLIRAGPAATSTLQRTGVLTALRQAGSEGATVDRLAREAAIKADVLAPCLFYVLLADRVLQRVGEAWAFTEFGRKAFDSGVENSLTAFVGAYGCVLQELPATLKGERTYGIDFERRGEMVALASLGATRVGFPFIIERLRRDGVRCVVDLGCGAAGVLLEFCALDSGLRGIGIDISVAAIAEARLNVERAGLASRIEFLAADLTDIARWKRCLNDSPVSAFHCTGVLHELLRDGERAVVGFLRSMRTLFPGCLFFLGEFDGRTEEDYRCVEEPLLRVKDLWYQDLIHPLTGQGKPQPREVWLKMIATAGISVLEVAPFRHNIYVLRL
jgi:SAM-dependent methyltransferase